MDCWFYIDFWRINVILKFDAYPVPWVDELLDHLGEAWYIITLDLTKGYWHIPLDSVSQEKNIFTTPRGFYHFSRMSFSLHGVPVIFQWLIDRLLLSQVEYTAVCQDNVVIYIAAGRTT